MPRAKILVADDQQRVRRLVAATLGEARWEMFYASNGQQALQLARAVRPDVILLDVNMPGLDGFEVCRQLKHDPATRQIAIVLLTARRDSESQIRGTLVGADAYFMKPFSPLALVSKLQELLPRTVAEQSGIEQPAPAGDAPGVLLPPASLPLGPVDPPAVVTTLAATGATGSSATISAVEAQQMLAYARDLNRSLEQLRTVYAELERSYLATIEALAAALDARDSATEGHCERVTGITLLIAEQLGLQGPELKALHYGAALHDIGKIGIPDAILRKPGQLTEEEWALMRQHPQLGERIIAGIDFLRSAVPVVLYHHERWDGSGYPFGLAGETIPLGARIFSVADTFDAMISNRPYRRGLPFERALAEIHRVAGSQLDPTVVEAFRQVFERVIALPAVQGAQTAPIAGLDVPVGTATGADLPAHHARP
ncbi:MAG: response regulator [Chloroflexi bacterium]|nr:response regulator [Chloroflexota bacterium]